MKLSIIIVNFNVKYFLEQCLFSVLKATRNISSEIFVVDNASTDSSRKYLEPLFNSVKFKWNNQNIGFGAASNSVLNEARGDYVLFLNPDTILPEDSLEKSLSFAESQTGFGALGIKMLDGNGKFLKESKRSFPSFSGTFFKISGLHAVFPSSKTFAAYYAGNLKNDSNQEVDVLAGAYMLLSRQAIQITKGFDESFFMYGEDIDLSYRIHKAGLKNFYFADSTIIHFKGESTQRNSTAYIRHFYGAMNLYVDKHVTGNKGHLMKLGIIAAKWKAMLPEISFLIKTNKNKIQSTAIVSGQAAFNKIIQLVKFAKSPLMIKGRIAITPADKFQSIGEISHILQDVNNKKYDTLILCEGDLSFKQIISIVSSYSGKMNYFFHASGSQSIVGSDEKDRNGVFIATPEDEYFATSQ